jgi:hypothetical protein
MSTAFASCQLPVFGIKTKLEIGNRKLTRPSILNFTETSM